MREGREDRAAVRRRLRQHARGGEGGMVREEARRWEGGTAGEGARRCEGWMVREGSVWLKGRIVEEMAVMWIVTIIARVWRGLLGTGQDKHTPSEQDLTLDIYLRNCDPSRIISLTTTPTPGVNISIFNPTLK